MAKERIRVLISAPSLSVNKTVSGISAVVSSIIENVQDVEFFHLKAGRSDHDFFGIVGTLTFLINVLRFPFIINKHQIDIYHQNLPLNTKAIIREYVFNRLATLCKLPVLLHIHGGRFIKEKPASKLLYLMTSRLLKGSRVVVVLNKFEQGQLLTLYNCQTRVLGNAIDLNKFSLKQQLQSYKTPQFIFLGRLHESKGLHEILEAFKELHKKYSFRFCLCGAGPQEKYFTKQFENELKDDFIFKGVVSGDEKLKAIQLSDYFVLPSYFEGLPISLLETMSCGLIPIVSDDESLSLIVEHRVNGIVVKKKSSTDLKRKIEELLNMSMEDRIVLAQNARATIEKSYDISVYVKNIKKSYKELIK